MKFCADPQCERVGEPLPRSAFYERSRSADGLHSWCKKCVIRKNKARYRERRQEVKRFGEVQRKANVATRPRFAFSLVYDAIKSGSRTREEIQRATKLSFDDIGAALVELCFEAKGVVIKNRKYIPIEEVLAA